MAFPDDPLDITVSVAYEADPLAEPSSWTFTEITSADPEDNMVRAPVVITRGRAGEQGSVGPSSCDFDVINPDGVFSPRNVGGANYGRFGRNTPVRVSADPGSGAVVRSTALVASWPPRWTGPDIDDHVPVRANGLLRRLGQGQSPLKSALYRVSLAANPVAYWPLEGEGEQTEAPSGLSGQPPIRAVTTFPFVTASAPAGASSALDMVAAELAISWVVVDKGSTADFQVEFTAVSDLGGATNVLAIQSPAGTFVAGPNTADADGEPHHFSYQFTTNGAAVDLNKYVDGVLITSLPGFGTSITNSVTLGLYRGGHTSGTVLLSHVAVLVGISASAGRAAAADGYAGEEAAVRFARLCDEESIPNDVASGSSEPMGPQTTKTLLDLLRECEAADEGLIVERRTGELGFDTRGSRENQPVTLTLDYEEGHVTDFYPVDDDRYLRNDVTITRTGGSSGRFVDEDGPLGVAAVGRYDDAATLNLEEDDQAVQHASLRVGLGTVDEPRYLGIQVDLHEHPDLIDAWLACDIGSRIQITNAPVHLVGPNTIDLIIEGYTETLDVNFWQVELNCAPYGPYRAGVYAEDSMSLLTAETTTSTTWRIGCQPDFTEDADDLPVDLLAGAEVVTVTAVAAVAPSILAGTPAHADNASVTPTNPSHLEGDLMLVFAAIRSSGTGTVSDLSGYTSLYTFGNMRIFGKYATSAAMADPTVSFAGGAAGDTTSAVVVRARGCQITVLNSKEQLNGSAQDISFPHYVQEGDVQVLQFCWKQDDYTSVAPSTYTEVVEASTTTGNDQSLYVVRGPVSTDSVPSATSSHTVTGGAAAISRVVFLTLPRGVADLTVTRSVNGVSTTHAQLADVQVDKPLVWAL